MTGSYYRIVAALCADHRWPLPAAEVPVCPPRRWKFDLAWPSIRLAVEVQGGLFPHKGTAATGRHTQGPALLREYEKLNHATLTGYRVLLVTPWQITDGTLTGLLERFFRDGVQAPGPAGCSRHRPAQPDCPACLAVAHAAHAEGGR